MSFFLLLNINSILKNVENQTVAGQVNVEITSLNVNLVCFDSISSKDNLVEKSGAVR